LIIWLASYPRSGNTLLRTVLKQTMGLGSFSDGADDQILNENEMDTVGIKKIDRCWDDFYQQATASKDVFLVKTHNPPSDSQPAIYVVRDGRSSTESYAAFHKSFAPNPELSPSIMELMVGEDFYGDWSSHFEAWNSRKEGRLLLVRFEELVNANDVLLEKLRLFIGFEGDVKSFNNPIEELRSNHAEFFRKGEKLWKKSAKWTEKEESFFIALHGDLLCKLGYVSESEYVDTLNNLDPAVVRLLKLAKRGFSARNKWHLEAIAKEKVIQQFLKLRKT